MKKLPIWSYKLKSVQTFQQNNNHNHASSKDKQKKNRKNSHNHTNQHNNYQQSPVSEIVSGSHNSSKNHYEEIGHGYWYTPSGIQIQLVTIYTDPQYQIYTSATALNEQKPAIPSKEGKGPIKSQQHKDNQKQQPYLNFLAYEYMSNTGRNKFNIKYSAIYERSTNRIIWLNYPIYAVVPDHSSKHEDYKIDYDSSGRYQIIKVQSMQLISTLNNHNQLQYDSISQHQTPTDTQTKPCLKFLPHISTTLHPHPYSNKSSTNQYIYLSGSNPVNCWELTSYIWEYSCGLGVWRELGGLDAGVRGQFNGKQHSYMKYGGVERRLYKQDKFNANYTSSLEDKFQNEQKQSSKYSTVSYNNPNNINHTFDAHHVSSMNNTKNNRMVSSSKQKKLKIQPNIQNKSMSRQKSKIGEKQRLKMLNPTVASMASTMVIKQKQKQHIKPLNKFIYPSSQVHSNNKINMVGAVQQYNILIKNQLSTNLNNDKWVFVIDHIVFVFRTASIDIFPICYSKQGQINSQSQIISISLAHPYKNATSMDNYEDGGNYNASTGKKQRKQRHESKISLQKQKEKSKDRYRKQHSHTQPSTDTKQQLDMSSLLSINQSLIPINPQQDRYISCQTTSPTSTSTLILTQPPPNSIRQPILLQLVVSRANNLAQNKNKSLSHYIFHFFKIQSVQYYVSVCRYDLGIFLKAGGQGGSSVGVGTPDAGTKFSSIINQIVYMSINNNAHHYSNSKTHSISNIQPNQSKKPSHNQSSQNLTLINNPGNISLEQQKIQYHQLNLQSAQKNNTTDKGTWNGQYLTLYGKTRKPIDSSSILPTFSGSPNPSVSNINMFNLQTHTYTIDMSLLQVIPLNRSTNISLASYFQNKQYCDLVFLAQKRQIYCNRQLFQLYSSRFKKLYTNSNTKPKPSKISQQVPNSSNEGPTLVKLDHTKLSTIYFLIQQLYHNFSIPVSNMDEATIIDLMILAHKFQIVELQVFCEGQIQFSLENFSRLYDYFRNSETIHFREEFLKFFIIHAQDIIKTMPIGKIQQLIRLTYSPECPHPTTTQIKTKLEHNYTIRQQQSGSGSALGLNSGQVRQFNKSINYAGIIKSQELVLRVCLKCHRLLGFDSQYPSHRKNKSMVRGSSVGGFMHKKKDNNSN